MAQKVPEHLANMLRPYVFVLREGQEITNDYLDYHLLMLQTTCPEVIPSPFKAHKENPLLRPTFIPSGLH